MANKKLLYHDADTGATIPVLATDNGDGTWRLAVDAQVDVGDIEIGAVELKNATDDTRAKVGAGTSIAAADNALAVQASVLGVTTGSGVTDDSDGTHQQYLRGLVKILHDIWDATTHAFGVKGTGAAGTAATGVVTVQGIASMTPVQETIVSQTVAGGTKISPTGGYKTVAVPGTGEPLVGASTKVLMFSVIARIANTKNVYLGDSAVDEVTSKQITLAPGAIATFAAPIGYYIDMAEFYLDAEFAAEGVDFVYLK